jgi:hypothetical protein
MTHEYYVTKDGFLIENWHTNIGMITGMITQVYAPHELQEAAEILEERLVKGSNVRFKIEIEGEE